MARAALAVVDEVLFVLPRVLPHKDYETIGFDSRLQLLLAAVRGESRFCVASSQRGLFVEIAEECRELYGSGPKLLFVCGRDAAERIVHWDYGAPGAFRGMLDRFDLLVAPRKGGYDAPPEMRSRIHPLQVPADLDEISASEVRARIARGDNWEHLVPEPIVAMVRELYSGCADY